MQGGTDQVLVAVEEEDNDMQKKDPMNWEGMEDSVDSNSLTTAHDREEGLWRG